jgi:hypothetical protein
LQRFSGVGDLKEFPALYRDRPYWYFPITRIQPQRFGNGECLLEWEKQRGESVVEEY